MVGIEYPIPSLNGTLTGIPTLSSRLSIPSGYFPEEYSGPYEVKPSASTNQVLETSGKYLTENVNVLKIPMFEVSNLSGGYTVTIAKEA